MIDIADRVVTLLISIFAVAITFSKKKFSKDNTERDRKIRVLLRVAGTVLFMVTLIQLLIDVGTK